MHSIVQDFAIINVGKLEEKFQGGEQISPKTLAEKGILRKKKGKLPIVKILSKGELSKKLIISDCEVSLSVKEKIEKAGGQVRLKSKN